MSWLLEDSDCGQQYRHQVSIFLFLQSFLRILTSSWFRASFVAFLLAFFGLKKYFQWRNVVNLVERIPGPPTHWLLGHANLVLELDRVKFSYGTYVCEYQELSRDSRNFQVQPKTRQFLPIKSKLLGTCFILRQHNRNCILSWSTDNGCFCKNTLSESAIQKQGHC